MQILFSKQKQSDSCVLSQNNRPAAILRFSALFSLLIEYMVSNYGSLYDAVILSEIQAAHRNIAV